MRKVSPLREYFQSGYDAGDIFENEEYSFDEELWCWRHEHLGILVWADPLDLRDADDAKEPGEVYFHYTSLLAFRNITNEAKEKVEVWASLITSGEKANAWWGKGIYTVPKPPDEWASTELLLDNNYRSMMRRDREARGDQYVNEEYPKRVQCCIPIVVHPDNAFDVSVRQTPEMRRENKPPGTNLANVELNPPGETRHRTCVVIRNGGRIRRLRSSLKDNHLHAQGDLLTRALRRARQVATKHGLQNDESIRALLRVAIIYSQQSQHAKAKQILEVVVEYRRKMLGEQDLSTLRQRSRLAAVLMNLGKFRQARVA